MSRRRFILALLNVISGCFYIAQRQPENGLLLYGWLSVSL